MVYTKRLCVVWICFLLVSSAFSVLAGDADASGMKASDTNDPPVVSIDYPSNNRIVWRDEATADRPMIIEGTASDSDGDVQFVEIKIDDGVWQTAAGTESWSYEWNISSVSQGRHIVSARSYDGSDYSAVQSINVTIDTLDDPSPTVIITSPKQGEYVSGFVTVKGYTVDSGGSVEYVEIKIDDGAWTKASCPYLTTKPAIWGHNWSTVDVEDGNHTIRVRSYDGEYYSDVVSTTVRVSNNHPPSVSITSPEDGATVNDTVVINGTASDEDGGEQALNDTLNNRVEVRIGDGNWMTAIEDWMHVSNTTLTAWTYTWNTTEIEDGDYTVDVRVYDGIDHSDIESITVTVDNDKKDSDDTPGFETLSLLVALAAALLVWRRLQR